MIEKPFENWLPIPEYEDLYEIDTFGNIKSLDRKVRNNNGFRVIKGKILKPKLDDKGYYRIGLTKNKKQKFYFIHRLVALTFIPNPNNYPIINHKDSNPKNNYVENLEWCDSKYNNNYGNRNKKIGVANSKKVKQYDLKGNYIKTWSSIMQVERTLKIQNSNIVKNCKGRSNKAGGYIWKYE